MKNLNLVLVMLGGAAFTYFAISNKAKADPNTFWTGSGSQYPFVDLMISEVEKANSLKLFANTKSFLEVLVTFDTRKNSEIQADNPRVLPIVEYVVIEVPLDDARYLAVKPRSVILSIYGGSDPLNVDTQNFRGNIIYGPGAEAKDLAKYTALKLKGQPISGVRLI